MEGATWPVVSSRCPAAVYHLVFHYGQQTTTDTGATDKDYRLFTMNQNRLDSYRNWFEYERDCHAKVLVSQRSP